MKLKKAKKGFTLVELVVVIAIIAVLSTVSVVGYFGFTKKANVSGDKALVSQLNTILKADQATNGKAETPTEAIEAVKESGYLVEKLAAKTSKYKIVWNQKDNEFALLDEEEKAVAGKVSSNAYENWVFADSYNAEEGYSVYLNSGYSGNSTLDITTGLDVGENASVEVVNYTKTTEAKDVTIRTNGGTLNIDADTDSVRHYSLVDSVNIASCAMSSYHEYGNVEGTIELTAGHVEIESTGAVSVVNIVATTSEGFSLTNNKGGEVNLVKAKNPEVIKADGDNKNITVTDRTGVMTNENKDAVAYVESKGFINEWSTSLVSGKTILLKDLNDKVYNLRVNKGVEATFDLNGHKFKTDESGNSAVYGSLVMKDSSSDESGLYYCEVDYIRNKQDGCVIVARGQEALFILESGTIEAKDGSGNFTNNRGQFGIGIWNGATININGGTIKAGWYAIAGNGDDTSSTSYININGGKLVSVCDYAIYLPHNGITTINGGLIDGATGAFCLNRGSLIINNGYISSAGTGNFGTAGDGTDAVGKKSLIMAYAQYSDCTVVVNGGNFSVGNDIPIFEVGSKHIATIKISAGTYNKYLDKWVASGYECVKVEDGTWEVTKK